MSRSKAFFSIDAALSLSVAIAAFVLFSSLFFSYSSLAFAQAKEKSGSLLALRASSHILGQMSYQSQSPLGGYRKEWEVDSSRLQGLQPLLARTGKHYAYYSLHSPDGLLAEISEGTAESQVYCARRLAWCGHSPCRLEVCIS